MSIIHQIYCTHCTHGSSALERREGELARRVFGYSARAASVEGDQLRHYYAQIEPYLYYFLPRDTPDDRKLQLGASTAPRRMFFIPSAGGLQVAGQVCYRATDCEGRPGSYFAHVLVQEPGDAQPRWTALDWLRLWGAPGWVQEDSPEMPHLLPALESPADLLGQSAPAIDDPLLASFLREAADSPALHDPAGILPERWKAMEPGRRCLWFREALSRYLDAAAADPRQTVWLVVEPAVAALWAYGIARLLPEGPLRNDLGFSTFETDPQRANAPLAATWFHDPQAVGAEPEGVRLPGLVVNTLVAPDPEKPRPARKYATAILREVVEGGCEAAQRELAVFASVHAERPQQLESLAAADEIVSAMLDTGTLSGDDWRSSPQTTQCVRLRLGQRLAAMEDLDAGLKGVVQGPAFLTVVELLTAKPPLRDARRALIHLLKEIPPERILGLLRLPGVTDEDKITVLLRHIHARGGLPVGCEFIWEEFAARDETKRRAGAVLMARVLVRLPPKDLKRLFQSAPRPATTGFVLNLMRMLRNKKVKPPALSAVVQGMDEEAVLALLRTSGPEFLRTYPKREPVMGEKLALLLRTLPRHPEQFKDRLELVLAGQHLFSEDQYVRAATAWDACHRKIQEVARLQKPDSSVSEQMRMALLLAACRELAMAADQAMSVDAVDVEYTWTQKRDMLLRISQEVLSGLPLLLPGPWEHDVLLQRIGFQFQQHRWPMEPLKKEGPAKKEGPRRLVGPEEKSLATTSIWTILGIVVLLLALTVLIVYGAMKLFSTGGGTTKVPKRPTRGGVDRQKNPAPDSTSNSRTGILACRSPGILVCRGTDILVCRSPGILVCRPTRSADPPLLTMAQAAEANLTAAIIDGVPGLGRPWRARLRKIGTRDWGLGI